MKKIEEHTYGGHIFMRLELDGVIEEVSCYPGSDNRWETYRTSADDNPDRRRRIIKAFKELY